VFCELTSLLVLASSAPLVTQPDTKKRNGTSIQTQVSQVKDFVTCLLRGVSMSPNTVGRQITAQEYMAILPTLWMLLSSCDSVDDIDIICVLLDHARRASSAAAAKRPTVDFLVRLMLVGL
jgi:pre-rRNA-processing protein IPI1